MAKAKLMDFDKALELFEPVLGSPEQNDRLGTSMAVGDGWEMKVNAFNPDASAAVAKANGTGCNDGNACTQTDTCQAGTCTGANPVACATPEYLRKAGTPESPQELKNHSCLCTTRPFTKGVWPFLGPKGRENVRVSGLVAPSTAITMRYMALDNAGIALLPLFCVAEDIKQGRLVRILQDYQVPEQSISAYYPNSSQQTKIMKLFLNFLKDRFRTAVWATI